MYTPKHYAISDREAMLSFMRRFSFATLITSKNEVPVATHLPFIISERADKVILNSHLAKANPQWQEMAMRQSLVIFSEPHAYISPSFYDKEQNVPTWNYVSVHAYGQARIIEAQEESMGVLESMIETFEASYRAQWDKLEDEYKLRMLRGIVAFEIEVTDLQGKGKLSQNKTEAERRNIIAAFSRSENDNERQIAAYMQKEMDL